MLVHKIIFILNCFTYLRMCSVFCHCVFVLYVFINGSSYSVIADLFVLLVRYLNI